MRFYVYENVVLFTIDNRVCMYILYTLDVNDIIGAN